MTKKLPPGAFEQYLALGSTRSYDAVAEHFGTSKRTVTRQAAKEQWQERVEKIERRAREGADEKMAESLEQMNVRHLRILQVIQGRALEALKAMPLATAMEAVRSLEATIRQERVIRGEPGERTAMSMEEVVRQQYGRWVVTENDEDADGEDEESGAAR